MPSETKYFNNAIFKKISITPCNIEYNPIIEIVPSAIMLTDSIIIAPNTDTIAVTIYTDSTAPDTILESKYHKIFNELVSCFDIMRKRRDFSTQFIIKELSCTLERLKSKVPEDPSVFNYTILSVAQLYY